MLSAYAPHARYIADARLTADLPRVILGVALIEGLYNIMLRLLDTGLLGLPSGFTEGYYYGTTRAGLIAQLLSFGLLAGAVIVVARLLHQRSALSLMGGAWGLRQMKQVTIGVLLLFLVSDLLPPYWNTEGLHMNGGLSWLLLLPVSLAALTVQIGAEELLYRGYIQQQIAARFHSPWIWLTLPNVMFALAHWDETAPLPEAVQYMIWAFFFGLAASDLTARTGSLGAAAGFHLANNAYAFLLFGDAGMDDSGLALFVFDAPDARPVDAATDALPQLWLPPGFVIELSFVFLMWLTARLVLRR
ncbi:MAG: hypothetical protein CML60_10820 [Rhodobacteraceae bacterium]|nr:hypothetical protein [Paracoccaceae bacterium]MBT26870.1 hypothetical protein [Paracoccaceae bacterium]